MKKLIIIILTAGAFYASAFDSADNAGAKGADAISARHAMMAGL